MSSSSGTSSQSSASSMIVLSAVVLLWFSGTSTTPLRNPYRASSSQETQEPLEQQNQFGRKGIDSTYLEEQEEALLRVGQVTLQLTEMLREMERDGDGSLGFEDCGVVSEEEAFGTDFDFGCKSTFQEELKKDNPEEKEEVAEEVGLPLFINAKGCLQDDLLFVKKAEEGLRHGARPQLVEEGEGGTYFLSSSKQERVAVFKPKNEEPGCVGNPKRSGIDAGGNPGSVMEDDSSSTSSLPEGVPLGEGWKREIAAFRLDHGNFANVPNTVEASIFDPKSDTAKDGSLQEFVPSIGQAWDMGYTKFPTDDVHAIGALDIRLFNADRHGGNMLVTEQGELIPIDHSYSLLEEEHMTSLSWFEWMTYPQAKRPFSAHTLEYVKSLKPWEDGKTLRELGIGESAVRVSIASTLFLQQAAAFGLTLHAIGSLLCPKIPTEVSAFVRCFRVARSRAESYSDGFDALPEEDKTAAIVKEFSALLGDLIAQST